MLRSRVKSMIVTEILDKHISLIYFLPVFAVSNSTADFCPSQNLSRSIDLSYREQGTLRHLPCRSCGCGRFFAVGETSSRLDREIDLRVFFGDRFGLAKYFPQLSEYSAAVYSPTICHCLLRLKNANSVIDKHA